MVFFYNDTEERSEQSFKGGRIDPTKMVLKHCENQFFLELIVKSDTSTLVDKFQAEKELKICRAKQEYWTKRLGYDHALFTVEFAKLKKRWNRTD